MDEKSEIKIGQARFDIVTPPDVPQISGEYELVGEARPSGDRIWWNRVTKGKVTEEPERNNFPFRAIISDWDGTILNTESEDGFFVVRFISFLRDAGVGGSDDYLRTLRHKAYRWQGTFAGSIQGMLDNISNDKTTTGKSFTHDELSELIKVYSADNLIRWAGQNGKDYGDLTNNAHLVIADRIEYIGMELLSKNPQRVLEFAPLMTGVLDFIKAVPQDVLFAIASASRKKTTIRPILEAYAKIGEPYLKDRIGNNIVGEEDLYNQIKPDTNFYQQAAWSLGHILHSEGRIPPGGVEAQDILFVGDRIARTNIFDVPLSRRMYHLVVNADVSEAELGPLTAVSGNFNTLMEALTRPAIQIKNPTLRRLARTLSH